MHPAQIQDDIDDRGDQRTDHRAGYAKNKHAGYGGQQRDDRFQTDLFAGDQRVEHLDFLSK